MLASVASACIPTPPSLPPVVPRECANTTPTTAADYGRLINRRSTTYAAGDLIGVVRRPGRSSVWFLGDPFYGRVLPDGGIDGGGRLIRNLLIAEDGRCLTPRFGGTADLAGEVFANPAPNTWYWNGGAVALPDGSIDVVLHRMEVFDAGIPGFNFRPIGIEVAHLRPDLSIASITSVPSSAYVVNGKLLGFGTSVVTDGVNAYLYAIDSGPAPRVDADGVVSMVDGLREYVARAPLASIASGAWEYSSCSDPCTNRVWVADPSAVTPMQIAPSTSFPPDDPANNIPLALINVVRYGTGYVAVAKGSDLPAASGDAALQKVYGWTSATPDGPWHPLGAIGTTKLPFPSAPGANSYGARLIDSAAAGWVLTWNTNADLEFVSTHARAYGPQFATPTGLP